MEALKRARRPVRREVEKHLTELNDLLKEVPLNTEAINVKVKLLQDAFEKLQAHDHLIVEQLTEDNVPEADENKEWDEIGELVNRVETARQLKERLVPSPTIPLTLSSESIAGGNALENKTRTFKLPAVQMKKFSGKLKDWLGFWVQFQKLHEDAHLTGSDKFQYLLQSLEHNTDAYETAILYPPSNENYERVIESLKRQYANRDLQLQVYIQEILGLVISNVSSKEKLSVKSLFMKLDSHLRALKSLELEKADPATWLFPLVEACLPEQILYNWQQRPLSSHDGSKDDPPRTRLDILMSFVEREVQIRQRIDLTKSFANQQQGDNQDKRARDKKIDKRLVPPPVPTLSSFHAHDKRVCVFCERSNHASEECFQARKMSYEKKIDLLKEKRLCFRCTGNHLSNQCMSNVRCKICERGHLTILCKDMKIDLERRWSSASSPRNVTGDRIKRKHSKDARYTGAPDPKKSSEVRDPKTTSSNANVECTSDVALQTLFVKILCRDRSRVVRAFIDNGCQRSYILHSTAKELGLEPIGVERVVHSLFGGQQTSAVCHNKYKIKLSSLEDDYSNTFELRHNNKICNELPRITLRYPEIMNELREKNVRVSDVDHSTKQIELLIGADIYAKIMTGGIMELRSGVVAVRTKLGWTLLGEVTGTKDEHCASATYIAMSVQDVNIAKLWELETIGVEDPGMKKSEKEIIEMETEKFVKNISREESGRYSVKMPWKDNESYLPSNRQVAFKRLQSESNKLIEQGLFASYNKIFMEWEKSGFIERVSNDSESEKIHYLPHRPVIKESLTTPVRPVFDASCRVGRSPSLNDCLYTGENYVKAIPDLLQRFREKRVGFVSDIRKAFQMVGVDVEDRDAMRFLWWHDRTMGKVIEFRHSRVMFGATCSPFILGAVLHFHLTHLPAEKKEVGLKLLSTLYVDNCVSSESTVEKYHTFRREATELLKEAGMDLRMWLSNVDEFEDENTWIVSVLGLKWNRKSDEMYVNIKDYSIPDKITKRVVLSAVQRIYDPIGFTCPALIPMKLLLQRTWIQKLKWDEELPEEEKKAFLSWRKEIGDLGRVKVSRLSTAGVEDREKWSIHTFTDASKLAYAAAVFLRVEDESSTRVQLLAAKSRVAPIKTLLSIPKLELMGCLVGKRLAESVRDSLGLGQVREFFWSDSTTALAWIEKDPNMWSIFVSNRAKEIREGASSDKWRYLPGELNPADLPSRGCLPTKLLSLKWHEGPTWLSKSEDHWPKSVGERNEDEIEAEKRKSAHVNVESSALSVLEKVRESFSYFKQVRILGWVRRFLFNKLIKNPQKQRRGELSQIELDQAEFIIIRQIQHEAFPLEKRSDLTGLEIVEDDWGLLRVKTRLTYRDDPVNFKYPLLLPKNRDEVKQLVRDEHEKYFHAGVGFLSTHLRKKYWIIKPRQLIKRVVGKCIRCKRYTAKPVIPEPAPLPLDRIKTAEVFEVVGVDLAGPLILRNGKKIWIVIFTCAVYRAVHFEMVTTVSTRAFIQALERFVEKFRRPVIIYSDNETNFRGTDNWFRKMDWKAIEKIEGTPQIVWKFNPPTSSWWGGWWERLIRTAKDLLRRSVGKQSLNFKELKSALSGVAEVMNGRPLTYVSDNPADLEPLTPTLFLHPFGIVSFPERGASERVSESENLRIRYKYMDTLKKELKERFLKEYLAMLVNRKPKKSTRELVIGDLVYVGCDNLKRIQWPMGRIAELIPGADGVIRVARVLTERGNVVRSVQRLYPLEMDTEPETEKIIRDNELRTRSGRRVTKPKRFLNEA